MLYDNALLARVYLDAWRVTGNPLYRRITEEVLDFIVREMRDPSGGSIQLRTPTAKESKASSVDLRSSKPPPGPMGKCAISMSPVTVTGKNTISPMFPDHGCLLNSKIFRGRLKAKFDAARRNFKARENEFTGRRRFSRTGTASRFVRSPTLRRIWDEMTTANRGINAESFSKHYGTATVFFIASRMAVRDLTPISTTTPTLPMDYCRFTS
jgi:hypothetical protein